MSDPDTSEVEVIQQAAGGDGEAFTALFHQHFQAVYNYALWLSNDLALAEDLTQRHLSGRTTTCTSLVHPGSFAPGCIDLSIISWLITHAANDRHHHNRHLHLHRRQCVVTECVMAMRPVGLVRQTAARARDSDQRGMRRAMTFVL